MKQSYQRFWVLGALVSLMIACGGGGGGGDTVVVVPPPSITSFIAGSASINAGQATTLTAIFSNGTGTVSGVACSSRHPLRSPYLGNPDDDHHLHLVRY